MLRDQILVKPIDADRYSGLVVISSARKCIRGTVIAAGPGAFRIKRYRNERGEVCAIARKPGLIPMQLKVGDEVELSPARYMEIRVGGEPHLLAKEADVLGVIP